MQISVNKSNKTPPFEKKEGPGISDGSGCKQLANSLSNQHTIQTTIPRSQCHHGCILFASFTTHYHWDSLHEYCYVVGRVTPDCGFSLFKQRQGTIRDDAGK